jgi:hypothetical protein
MSIPPPLPDRDIRYARIRPSDLGPQDPRFDRLFRADYRTARRILWTVVPSKDGRRYPTRFQYKYRVWPKNLDPQQIDRLRDLMVRGLFYLSAPESFDDPFDMKAILSMAGTTGKLRERFRKMVRQFSKKGWVAQQAEVDRFMARGRDVWQRRMQSIMDKHLNEFGVFSFAGTPKSILMWSHYAENHTGICLQFEVARDAKTLSNAVPLSYVEDFPVYRWVGDEEQIRRALIHKFSDWDYEKGWRIIWEEGAGTYLQFNPASLSGSDLRNACEVGDGYSGSGTAVRATGRTTFCTCV